MGDKRATLIVLLILFLIIVISFNIEQTKAKVTTWDAPPDAITDPTTIIIVSPEENRTYTTNNVALLVNVGTQPMNTEGKTGNTHYIRSVLYKADWMESTERIFYHLADGLMAQKITITMNISGISDGPHNLTIYAKDSYSIETPSTVNFTIDTQIQENPIPEFPSWILLPLFITSSICVIIVRNKIRKNGL
ncbi:hypothetical protein ACFLRN_08460 [Thermoproteota archaeon]